MGFGQAVKVCFRKYVDFNGRARRSEYWWWIAFVAILQVVATVLDAAVLRHDTSSGNPGIVGSIVQAATFLPSLAVTARRLHDIDKSGFWQLIGLIPLIGWIVMLVWTVRSGNAGPNRFGDDPKRGIAGPQDTVRGQAY